jgi:hypothetical protein
MRYARSQGLLDSSFVLPQLLAAILLSIEQFTGVLARQLFLTERPGEPLISQEFAMTEKPGGGDELTQNSDQHDILGS